jgi:ATP-binding cassette subfamily B (MDR/TAP) protein 1
MSVESPIPTESLAPPLRDTDSVELVSPMTIDNTTKTLIKENVDDVIMNSEEEQTKDVREPSVKTSFPMIKVVGFEFIWILVGAVFAAGMGIVPLMFYLVLGNLFGGIASATPDEIASITSQAGIGIVIIACAGAVAGFGANFFLNMGAQRIGNNIKSTFFATCLRQEIGFFDIKKSGALINALSDDVNRVQDAFSTHVSTFIQNFAQVIGGIVMSLVANWQMALLMMTCFPIMGILAFGAGSVTRYLTQKASKQGADAVSTANEVITSMRTVRSMAGEYKEIERYRINLKKVGVTGFLRSLMTAITFSGFSFSIWGAVSLAFWYAGKMISEGNFDIGGLVKVFGVMLFAVIGLAQLMQILPEFVKAQTSAILLLKIIERKEAIRFKGGQTLTKVRGDLTFRNVNFRYPSRPKALVLNDLNLDVIAGQSVALVGSSGSGKSTIVGLVEKWYEPESGTISLDGVPLTDIDPQWLHQVVGIVTQEPTLFATTIKRNITYAVDTMNLFIKKRAPWCKDIPERLITDDMIFEAAKAANCHKFITDLTDGYETILGERGVSLSGGQKQRIAIARALLQDPKILLLDEATSALDTQSESLVQEALERLMQGRTSLVIAHRLSTIQNCDNIVVMKQGKVVEQGKHDQLIQIEDGHYYKLAKKQLGFGQAKSDSQSEDLSSRKSDADNDNTPLLQ